MAIPEIKKIREYATRSKREKWITSFSGYKSPEFDDTFIGIPTKDQDGNTTKSIGVSSNFEKVSKESDSYLRFYLILYCLQKSAYFYENSLKDARGNETFPYSESLRKFLSGYQTNSVDNSQITKGLTLDHVRFYRGSQLPDKYYKDINLITKYSKENQKYKNNVIGFLGRITYDSVVKHTLYSCLKGNPTTSVLSQILGSGYEKENASWEELALALEEKSFSYYIDPAGGVYNKAFPVICSFTKAKENESLDLLKKQSHDFISSKFQRNNINDDRLSEIIKFQGTDEKNIIKLPLGQTGLYAYCFIYDFAEVITQDNINTSGETLDILKLSLSFFSRRQLPFNNIQELQNTIAKIRKFLESKFPSEDLFKDLDFALNFKDKHGEECEFYLDKSKGIKNFLQNKTFEINIKNIINNLEKASSLMIKIFNDETKTNIQFSDFPKDKDKKFILHFDNFYNLLAVTSIKPEGVTQSLDLDPSSPFNLSEYTINKQNVDKIKLFFSNPDNLNFSIQNIYKFQQEIAINQEIAFVTDIFLKQTYNNLDNSGNKLIYETEENFSKPNVLKFDKNLNLLGLLKSDKKKEDFFNFSNDVVSLKNSIVKTFEINREKIINLNETSINKIDFQTISFLFFLNIEKLEKTEITIDNFKNIIHYPILESKIKPKKSETPLENPPTKKVYPALPTCAVSVSDRFVAVSQSNDWQEALFKIFEILKELGLDKLLAQAANDAYNSAKQYINSNIIDEKTAACIEKDLALIAKAIANYLDIYWFGIDFYEQAKTKILEIPEIIELPVLDFYANIKERITAFIVGVIIELLGKQISAVLNQLLLQCNVDSVLYSLLSKKDLENNAFPLNIPGTTGAGSIALGYRGASDSSVIARVPNPRVDLNILIDQSGIQTKEYVYEAFREKYNTSRLDNPSINFSNFEISNFFRLLSDSVDAGEMALLIRREATSQVENIMLLNIKNYLNNRFSFIYDSNTLNDLFLFLSKFINYELCYGIIINSLNDVFVNICDDIDQKLKEKFTPSAIYFSEEEISDYGKILSNKVDEACRSKGSFKQAFDLFTNGPSLLNEKLKKFTNTLVDQTVDSTEIQFSSSWTSSAGDKKLSYFEFFPLQPVSISSNSNYNTLTKEKWYNYILLGVGSPTANDQFYSWGYFNSIDGKNDDFSKKIASFNTSSNFLQSFKTKINESINSANNNQLKTELKALNAYELKLSKITEQNIIPFENIVPFKNVLNETEEKINISEYDPSLAETIKNQIDKIIKDTKGYLDDDEKLAVNNLINHYNQNAINVYNKKEYLSVKEYFLNKFVGIVKDGLLDSWKNLKFNYSKVWKFFTDIGYTEEEWNKVEKYDY